MISLRSAGYPVNPDSGASAPYPPTYLLLDTAAIVPDMVAILSCPAKPVFNNATRSFDNGAGHQAPEKGDDQMQLSFQTPVNSDLTWKMLSQKVGKVPSGPVPDSANEICVRVNDTVAFTAPWIAIKDGPHYRFGGYDNGQNFSALININPTQGITLVRAYMGSTSEVAANMTTTVYYR